MNDIQTEATATHGCGVCDGKLIYDGDDDGLPSWVCETCETWHTAKDCCEVSA